MAERGSMAARVSPCYLNRHDPIEVGFGWGKLTFQAARVMMNTAFPLQGDTLINCLAPPLNEYEFPRDLYRYSLGLL
ncbi:unnamed protein product [Discosporangium mesarthrocarpum]